LFSHLQKYDVFFAAAVSLLLASFITWPVVLSPSELLVGHPGNDTWNHVWGYWWVADAISNGEWPTNADLLAHPNGGTLYFIDTMQVVFSLPIQWLFGPEVAYNCVVILQLAFCSFSAWLLSRHLTGDSIASGIALVIFGTAPHILGQAYNGISETICAGWVPFTLWALLRNIKNPSFRNSLILGFSAGICVLTSWYYGLFAALSSILIVFWYALRHSWLVEWKLMLRWNSLATLIAALLVVGPFITFQRSLSASDAIVTRDPEFVENSLLNHNITDVVSLVNPTTIPSPDLFSLYGEELIIVIYLGWISLFLSLYAIWNTRPRHQLSMWIWVGLVFLLFSLGPYLNVGGEYVLIQGKKIPLPFLPLYKAFPIFDRISHPFRFITVVSLCLGILSAYGFRSWVRRYSKKWQWALLVLLSFAVVAEVHWFSPAHIPIPASSAYIPEAYGDLKADETEGAVLDLPLTTPNLERAVYVWYQKEHGRPIPWGLNDPMPRVLSQNYLSMTLIRMEATHSRSLPSILPELDLVVSARALARQGYRFIVVHDKFYPKFKVEQVHTLLSALLGKPKEYPADQIKVYTLEQL
jgi:hypothetical protein